MSCTAGPPRKSIEELFRPSERPTRTRDRLILVALDLFYAQGFHAVGLDQIIQAAGVTKTTFYNHFASKDDLVLAAVEKRCEWESAAWIRAMEERGDGDPRKTLLAMFDVMHDWFNHPDFHGCLFVNATHEFPQPHDPVHQAARRHKVKTHAYLAGLADAAGAEEPDLFASELMLLSEGAISTRLAMGDDGAARIARRTAEILLERQLPAAV